MDERRVVPVRLEGRGIAGGGDLVSIGSEAEVLIIARAKLAGASPSMKAADRAFGAVCGEDRLAASMAWLMLAADLPDCILCSGSMSGFNGELFASSSAARTRDWRSYQLAHTAHTCAGL